MTDPYHQITIEVPAKRVFAVRVTSRVYGPRGPNMATPESIRVDRRPSWRLRRQVVLLAPRFP